MLEIASSSSSSSSSSSFLLLFLLVGNVLVQRCWCTHARPDSNYRPRQRLPLTRRYAQLSDISDAGIPATSPRAQRLPLFNLFRWNNVPRTSGIFVPKLQHFLSFKYNSGKTNLLLLNKSYPRDEFKRNRKRRSHSLWSAISCQR